MPAKVQRIVPFLWFDSQAEEAATYYVSIFDNSAIRTVSRYDEACAKAAGQVVPTVLPELLTAKDPARSQRVMTAMLAMKKLDIEALKRAYAGASG